MTDRYIDLFSSQAQKHGLYIIAGSQPVIRDGDLYNVAHLFTPTGDVYTQDALHIPPIERADFDSALDHFADDLVSSRTALLEEAKRRDHRRLGQELDLFAFSDLGIISLRIWI